ncbi:MAG: sigma-70 family RNA polymerase sigma factor [Defluviitaleaceae bacterium]|nr:sigma-70 family RNA polymerase sigma factor [Defluviitaleaceae bacterium]
MFATDFEMLKYIQAERAAGNRDVFSLLIDKYGRLIYNMAYRYVNNREDANDMAQEAAIKLFKNIMTVILPPEKINNPDALRGWVVAVTVNTCIDELRKRKVRPAVSVSADDIIVKVESAEETAITNEHTREIMDAFKSLPEDQRTAVMLRDIYGLSYREMAQTAQVPVNTIKSRLSRARRALREILKNK